MRKVAAAAGGAAVLLFLLLTARAAASDGTTLAEPAWDLLKQLTWPGALVAALFSPVGRAAAGWITAATPARPSAQDKQLAEQLRCITEALEGMAEGLKRSSKVQEQTAQTLVQVQQSLAILLDRTPR